MDYALVTTSCPSLEVANRLAKGALDIRLAACVQRVPIHSTYWWLGNMEEGEEYALHFKTRAKLVEDLKQYILNNHPYTTPEVLVFNVEGGTPAYLRWIDDETAGGRL